MNHSESTQSICNYALMVLKVDRLKFRPMRRTTRVSYKRGFVIGRTNLKTGLITIDIFTPTKREPKKISSILRTLCHETAHHQKMPFRQIYRRHFITRAHYPEFYEQVGKNIEILKNDRILAKFFSPESAC